MADLLSPPTDPRQLRQMVIERTGPIVMPGCFDALGARLIELAGFDAVYMTGFGTAASLLGRPDIGLLGGAEMIDNARRIAAAVNVPVLADADTGYGNAINVIHTVRQYEQAGVAAIHLEDQVHPKRCGHMDGKEVVPADEFAAKVRAATEARTSDNFLIVARTDAKAPHGLDEARRRADLALEAGADVLFIEALQTPDEIQTVADTYRGTPLLFNWVEGGKTPQLTYSELSELGYAIVIMPITTLLAATGAITTILDQVKAEGTPADVADKIEVPLPEFADFTEMVGLPEVLDLQHRFA